MTIPSLKTYCQPVFVTPFGHVTSIYLIGSTSDWHLPIYPPTASCAVSNRVSVRVPGLPIRDYTRGCNNSVHTCAQMSAMDVTKKIRFERLYLISGMDTFGPWVNCPYAPTTLIVYLTIISRFLCNFFPKMAPHLFDHHDSPSNLAESRYPRLGTLLPHSAGNCNDVSKGYLEAFVFGSRTVHICA